MNPKKGNKSATLTLYVRLLSIQVATVRSLCPFLLTRYPKPYPAIAENREGEEIPKLGLWLIADGKD